MAEFIHAAAPTLALAAEAPATVLLRVLEAAQRMIAYCDNAAVGGAEDSDLAMLGLSTPSLDRALRDLRHSVREMNQAMVTDDGADFLAELHGQRRGRLVA